MGEIASCLIVFNVCSQMLHFSCNSSGPLLTCQSHWNSDCLPSNTSAQYLIEVKPQPGHPLWDLFRMLCWSGKVHSSSSIFVCALSCPQGYLSTQSQSGRETGAALQRIEGLDVRVVRRAIVNVAYSCVTGRLRHFRVQC